MAPKNSCLPASIYGGYTQTLFLGMTVIDFTASAGWNEQSSTLTVRLATDTCAGNRKYFDDSFNWKTDYFPNGDPGFNNAPVGSAVFFKVEDFEFAGIIQSYNLQEDPSAFPILTVNLISPGILLEGAQVILDGYQGSVFNVGNIFNVYAFLESITQTCPYDGTFGAPAGGFGNAQRTDRGLPWPLVKQALQVLLGGAGTSQYSWYGGVTYKEGLSVNRYGNIQSRGYVVDISELPDTTNDYRIEGNGLSLLELITKVCNDGGYEFFVDLLPTKGGPTPPITNVIKIRTVSRRNQPALGTIASFITNQNNTSAGRIITQDSIGEELRNEYNSSFLVGGQKRTIYEQTDSSLIVPFWGYNYDGSFNTAVWNPGGTDPQYYITLDTRAINTALNNPLPNPLYISESTLLITLGGDSDTFRNWVLSNIPLSDIGQYIGTTLGLNALSRLKLGSIIGEPPLDNWVLAGLAAKAIDDATISDLETVFNWLSSYTQENYGKKWLVAVPFVCYATDQDTLQLVYSDEPSAEGGWPTNAEVLGISFPTAESDFFADNDGKIQTVLKFQGAINIENLTSDDYVTDGTSVWVRGSIDDKWSVTNFGLTSSVAALVTINNPVNIQRFVSENYMALSGPNIRLSSALPANIGNYLLESSDKSDAVGPAPLPFFAPGPVAAAIPVKSNTQAYGPWVAQAYDNNNIRIDGKVQFEKDDALTPWDYGGVSYMLAAGNAKVLSSVTALQTSERGSVTIAGYPEKTLGLSITETPSRLTDRVLQVGSYGGYNFYYVNSGGTSTQAAQITNISVNVGSNGITTQYQISSFTPVFGRFNKNNAERLKQIGQQRLQIARQMRAFEAKTNQLNLATIRGGLARKQYNLNLASAHRSSAMVLLGKKYGKRTTVNIPTPSMLTYFDDYDNSALMTIDGMFRPVQKRVGTSPLPKEVANPTPPASQPNYTESPAPPLQEYTNLIVSTDYLDFLANPSSSIATRSDSAASGHNIEGVARSTKASLAASTGLFTIPKAEELGLPGYQSDYRYLAIRGPMVVHGWGYDVMGKPVPNDAIDSAGSIASSYDGASDKFFNGWLQDDTTWPVAPVDLRYDRKRGVWTIPPSFRIYEVSGNEIAPGAAGTVTVLNADDVYDTDGSVISNKTIQITNITQQPTPTGQYMAYYDNVNDQYWPIFPGSGGGSGGNIQFKDEALNCDLSSQLTSYTGISKVNLGSGLWADIIDSTSGEIYIHSLPQIQYTGNVYDSIDLLGNLTGIAAGCLLKISGISNISDEAWCSSHSVTVTNEHNNHLVFRTGLVVTADDTDSTKHYIDSYQIVYKEGSSASASQGQTDPIDNEPYNKITLLEGIDASYTDNCNLTLDTNIQAADYDPCVGQTQPGSYSKVYKFAFGKGLNANIQGTTVSVNSSFNLNGKEIDSLYTGPGIKADTSNNAGLCGAILFIDDDYVTGLVTGINGINVVSTYECGPPAIGNNIQTLNFAKGVDVSIAGNVANIEVHKFIGNAADKYDYQFPLPVGGQFENIYIGRGLTLFNDSCDYFIALDFGISKFGDSCNPPGDDPNLAIPMKIGHISFGDNFKVDVADGTAKVEYCAPDPFIAVTNCDNTMTVGTVLNDILQLSFVGFDGELTDDNALYITHQHKAYNILNGINGIDFQDLRFSDSFDIGNSPLKGNTTDPANCVLDISLIGITDNIEVVCATECANDSRYDVKRKLKFKDGLLVETTKCGENIFYPNDPPVNDPEEPVSEGRDFVVDYGGTASTTSSLDLSSVTFDGNSLLLLASAALLGAPLTVTLPSALALGFAKITVMKTDTSTNEIRLIITGGVSFGDGENEKLLTNQNEAIDIISNGVDILGI